MSMILPLEVGHQGKMMRVVYLIPGQRREREMVARYLDTFDQTILRFDLRPLAGTTNVDSRWIKQLWLTDRDVQLARTITPGNETRLF